MMVILHLLAIFGMTFGFKELDGPWDICSRFRSLLMRNKYFGAFFFKMFECNFCLGFHFSWITYLLGTPYHQWHFGTLVIYCFAGAITCITLSALLNKLYEERM